MNTRKIALPWLLVFITIAASLANTAAPLFLGGIFYWLSASRHSIAITKYFFGGIALSAFMEGPIVLLRHLKIVPAKNRFCHPILDFNKAMGLCLDNSANKVFTKPAYNNLTAIGLMPWST